MKKKRFHDDNKLATRHILAINIFSLSTLNVFKYCQNVFSIFPIDKLLICKKYKSYITFLEFCGSCSTETEKKNIDKTTKHDSINFSSSMMMI